MKKWKAHRECLKKEQVYRYHLQLEDKRLTYADLFRYWQQDDTFCSFFNNLLAEAPFEAFFWETPSVSKSKLHHPFEFVLVNGPQLADLAADPSGFRQVFREQQKSICVFPNLGGDALLLAPSPEGPLQYYAHIAAFVRHAAAWQQQALWQKLGQVMEAKVSEQPWWLSTSGLGVSWLHIRLDSQPKYYQHQPYCKNSLLFEPS